MCLIHNKAFRFGGAVMLSYNVFIGAFVALKNLLCDFAPHRLSVKKYACNKWYKKSVWRL